MYRQGLEEDAKVMGLLGKAYCIFESEATRMLAAGEYMQLESYLARWRMRLDYSGILRGTGG